MQKIIKVTKGSGTGETKLSAFDAALFDAGIANYNLIRLSSIIPEGYAPKAEKIKMNGSTDFGNKLYVVYASQIENEIGKEAWAGVGWVMSKTDPKRGLFVEHEGADRAQIERLINESIISMVRYRKEEYGEIHSEICGIKCESKPVCALVAAVYKSEGWE
ncbi:MAG: pyruvoyl-dependent arginine decarboxylase [Candidatus Pacebacteria bacterium]|nr:pyruvoyl-dependent arginine decarboxylase [Candidatus Paceibacterota bacterium]MDD5357142.1 pyruvoyl-dependent arginine decarboxylase [Candidatus Paceibacterota bacterium]